MDPDTAAAFQASLPAYKKTRGCENTGRDA